METDLDLAECGRIWSRLLGSTFLVLRNESRNDNFKKLTFYCKSCYFTSELKSLLHGIL